MMPRCRCLSHALPSMNRVGCCLNSAGALLILCGLFVTFLGVTQRLSFLASSLGPATSAIGGVSLVIGICMGIYIRRMENRDQRLLTQIQSQTYQPVPLADDTAKCCFPAPSVKKEYPSMELVSGSGSIQYPWYYHKPFCPVYRAAFEGMDARLESPTPIPLGGPRPPVTDIPTRYFRPIRQEDSNGEARYIRGGREAQLVKQALGSRWQLVDTQNTTPWKAVTQRRRQHSEVRLQQPVPVLQPLQQQHNHSPASLSTSSRVAAASAVDNNVQPISTRLVQQNQQQQPHQLLQVPTTTGRHRSRTPLVLCGYQSPQEEPHNELQQHRQESHLPPKLRIQHNPDCIHADGNLLQRQQQQQHALNQQNLAEQQHQLLAREHSYSEIAPNPRPASLLKQDSVATRLTSRSLRSQTDLKYPKIENENNRRQFNTLPSVKISEKIKGLDVNSNNYIANNYNKSRNRALTNAKSPEYSSEESIWKLQCVQHRV